MYKRQSLAGRQFVTPDDVKRVCPAVLAHRLLVDSERSLHGVTALSVVEGIIERLPAPPLAED